MKYEVVDYDKSVSVLQIVQLILDGYEVVSHTDDWDLDYAVYVKGHKGKEEG